MIPKIEAPKANPEKLLAVVEDAYQGKLVLPEFQRSFVWAREDIEELLVSILQGYFIGTFLILDTPPEQALFPFRPVEGLQEVNTAATHLNHSTIRLVLDGQQRISSLFYVLYEPEIPLHQTKNPYRFFLWLDKLMDGNPDDAVLGISISDHRRLGEMEQAIEAGKAVRFSLFRDSAKFYHWLYSRQTVLDPDERQIVESFYQRFAHFMVPVVSISPEAGKDNIINIFERINRTGVSLSLFDLAAARLYLKGLRLHDLWKEFKQQNKAFAKLMKPESVLKTIALMQGKEARKSTLLDIIDKLEKEHFEQSWDKACHWLAKAYQRVVSPWGYGAVHVRWIPYSTLLVPLAALLCFVEENHGGEAMFHKLNRWYWGSVFGQRYDQAVDTTSYRDLRDIKEWLTGGNCPGWLNSLAIEKIDFSEVDERRSAIYRGIMCLIALAGAKDFISGQPAVLETCQDDHIFPHSQYKHEASVNCILNRTLISSNQIKSNKKPSEYLPLFLEKHGGDEQRLRATLQSHLISEQGQVAMQNEDFSAFLEARRLAFLGEINKRIRY
jgi:hypothetical protein